jgi:hypothetical protein
VLIAGAAAVKALRPEALEAAGPRE